MSALRLIIVSLMYHWRMHLAVALGVAAGTAVLTGALLVGDSMRGSLRALALERLGRIDEVLVADRFFRADLAQELMARPEVKAHFVEAVPVILLRATVERPDPESPARANQVQLIGCPARFWQLGSGGLGQPVVARQVVLNQPLAERLGAHAGQRLMLRVPRVGAIPADNLLGRRRETVASYGVTVQAIVPAEGLGRFGLRPTQHRPLNAYVSLEWLQGRLKRPGQVNAILVAGRRPDRPPPIEAHQQLQAALSPSLADFGIRIERTQRGYLNITSERMLLEPETERQLLQRLGHFPVQPALTYLANTIACGGREIPYSTVTAVDPRLDPPLGPLVSVDGSTIEAIEPGEIVLNQWAAEDLQARVGDTIRIVYFEPEAVGGRLRERSTSFRLAAVARLAEAADDPEFTPRVPGVTDELTMRTWDPPFPFDAARIRDRDETYWEQHRATPKAFVALSEGRRLWASRFGQTTSLRVDPGGQLTVARLQRRLRLPPEKLGFVFQPVKRQGLEAAAGTTPFNVLFLGFSFFIIAAAVMLVALLFRLGVEGRAHQVGILMAVGLSQRQVRRLLVAEGGVVAAVASLVGTVAGFGYAALMLVGLRSWWLAAVVTPFLRLFWSWTNLAIGYASGLVVAWLAIAWSIRRIGRVSPRQLLAGQTTEAEHLVASRSPVPAIVAAGLVMIALLIGLGATAMSEEARAGAFFGSGAVVLAAALVWTWSRLRAGATGAAVAAGGANLLRMAARNAARNPGRSSLGIGSMAATCFLIMSVSAFRQDPTAKEPDRQSGNGGFALVAESAQPIYHDLNAPAGRRELGMPDEADRLLAQCRVYPLRVKSGEDASCLNLYRPRQPRILGAPADFIRRGGFAFSAVRTDGRRPDNPWLLLEEDLGADQDGTPLVPVIMDDATAKYSLHLWEGVGQTLDITDGRGGAIRLRVVGLLKNSIFQGTVLMAESQLLVHFPGVSGYRFFLVETPRAEAEAVRDALESALSDYGLAVETTGQRLADFLAVQNTYLSTFQSLGGLGLLLGTFGLAAVQLRNVLERRSELALLRATGFRRSALAWMVMAESGLLLAAGLGFGLLAALVAVLPHLVAGAATVPWLWLGATLALVLLTGLVAAGAAVRAVLRAPLLAALRHE